MVFSYQYGTAVTGRAGKAFPTGCKTLSSERQEQEGLHTRYQTFLVPNIALAAAAPSPARTAPATPTVR